MRRLPWNWVAPLLLAVCCGTPLASAQDDTKDLHPYKGSSNAPAVQLTPNAPPDAGDKVERPAPTLSFAVAVLSAIIVLCIICVPSRKPESSTTR